MVKLLVMFGRGRDSCACCALGTLRSDDGDANTNVAEKQTLRPFKRFRPCTKSPSFLKVGKLRWS